MPCSYCSEAGHNISKCTQIHTQYNEDRLNYLTFNEFLKKLILYKYIPNSLKFKNINISNNYKYLFDKYTNTSYVHYMKDKNVFKLKFNIKSETRNSIDDNILRTRDKDTIYIIVPDIYNKSNIYLEELEVGYYIEDFESEYMGVTRYKIVEASWCL